jgi:hypothetical protein
MAPTTLDTTATTATAAPAPAKKTIEPKRYVIRTLPTGTTGKIKAERSHLMVSRWFTTDPAGGHLGQLFANKVYRLAESVAANLVRKGWSYCDASGAPTNEKPPAAVDPTVNPRPGTEEWQVQEFDRLLAAESEAAAAAAATPEEVVAQQAEDDRREEEKLNN